MKSIRISDNSYEFLKKMACEEHRSLISTLDLFIHIFKEIENEKGQELEKSCISPTQKRKVKEQKQKLVKIKNESI